MEKPQSMSVKEWIIKKMAINMVVSEKIIDVVVTHQFDSANDALSLNNIVEISGFGKFIFNVNKAKTYNEALLRMIKAYETIISNPETSDKKRFSTENKLQSVLSSIQSLKPKLNGYKENI